VLYLATKLDGADTDECLDNTWTNIEPLHVNRWRDESKSYDLPLYYYYAVDGTLKNNTKDLLHTCNGDCDAWADLMKDCLEANGVPSVSKVQAGPVPWTAIAAWNIRYYGQGYTPWGQPGRIASEYVSPNDGNGDLIPGILGQGPGSHTPVGKIFNYHKVIKVGSTFYDPSYGVSFTDTLQHRKDYTRDAIEAGFQSVRCGEDGLYRDLWVEIENQVYGNLWDDTPIDLGP